jgi:hypothetical protein
MDLGKIIGQIPHDWSRGLVSSLHRTPASGGRCCGFTDGRIDWHIRSVRRRHRSWPVLVQQAGPGPVVGRERVPRWRTLQRTAADVQMGTCGGANGRSPANGSASAHPSSGAHTSGRR